MAIEGKLKELRTKKDKLKMGGGKDKLKAQHDKGKLSARERLDILLDKGSFVEINGLMKHRAVDFDLDKTEIPGDGVITGYGTIEGKLVYVYSQDFTVMGGSLGRSTCFQDKLSNGSGHEGRSSCDRYKRFWRRKDTRRCRFPEGVWGYFLQEHNIVRGHPSDNSNYGALCWWCRLFSGNRGFCLHDRCYKLYVHNWASGCKNCVAPGCYI